MKKPFIKVAMSLLLIAATLLTLGIGAFAIGESHNVYTAPDLSKTSGKFDAFMIDFKTESENAIATYWALANYTLDIKESLKKLGYMKLGNPAGYAGMQVRNSDTDRVGIMSVWEYQSVDNKMKKETLNAIRMYPAGNDTFDNEGSGVKCIKDYTWNDNQWYRMLLLCWEDAELGRTFAGTWFYDYTAKKWTLFCYYNYQLVDSYFINGFSQFQENFSSNRANIYRSFNYTNFYVYDHETKEWVSTPKISLSSCTYPDKVGVVGGGLSEDGKCVTGYADGSKRDEGYVQLNTTLTIDQPDNPEYGIPAIGEFTARTAGNKTVFSWTAGAESTPQLSYDLKVVDENGNEILSSYQTRPEINELRVDKLAESEYKCTLTIKDVFGQETTATYATEGYTDKTPDSNETPEPTQLPITDAQPTGTPATTPVTGTQTPSPNGSSTVIIIAAVAAVIIVAVAAAVIIMKKKK